MYAHVFAIIILRSDILFIHHTKESLHTQEQSLLMQHAQRYNKLQEVMILLEQAKHVHRLVNILYA